MLRCVNTLYIHAYCVGGYYWSLSASKCDFAAIWCCTDTNEAVALRLLRRLLAT